MTGKPRSDFTFEEWVIFVFDHPVDDSRLEWYWDIDADWWDGPAALTVEYLTRAFENTETVFEPYSDRQLNQGLWYLASNACSEHMFALMELNVPWPARQRCIRSFQSLYRDCFAKRCTSHLSHLDEPGAGPLNAVCYMWWDVLPVAGRPQDPAYQEMNQAILQVMEAALKLDSIACQESALHGLGHWHLQYSSEVEEIIQGFLQRNKALPENLRKYALSAMSGCVL
jgi:hypothetical protein